MQIQANRSQSSQFLEQEVSRLNSLLQTKATECEEWARRYKSLEFTRQQEAEEFKKTIKGLQGTGFVNHNIHWADIINLNFLVKDLDKVHIRFNAERTAYETQIIQLQNKVTELETFTKNLQKDNERLTYLSNDRILDIDGLKKRYNELEEAYRLEVGDLQSQLELHKSNSFVKSLAKET